MGGATSLLMDGPVHRREQAKIDAARIRQTGSNKLSASNASMQQWVQSLQNSRRLRAAGDQVGAITENVGRNLDAAASGRMMARLAASEALGASIAQASAAGVGGTTIDLVNRTMQLSQDLQEEQLDRGVQSDLIGASRARGQAIGNAVDAMDNGVFQAPMDYTQYINHKRMNPLRKYLTFQAASVATYFGGPQAGAAVLDLADGQQRAINGDLDGAAARFTSGFEGAVSAGKSYTTRGNTPYGQDLWNSTRRRQAAAGANLQIGGSAPLPVPTGTGRMNIPY